MKDEEQSGVGRSQYIGKQKRAALAEACGEGFEELAAFGAVGVH
jgi:hypothetical protein